MSRVEPAKHEFVILAKFAVTIQSIEVCSCPLPRGIAEDGRLSPRSIPRLDWAVDGGVVQALAPCAPNFYADRLPYFAVSIHAKINQR